MCNVPDDLRNMTEEPYLEEVELSYEHKSGKVSKIVFYEWGITGSTGTVAHGLRVISYVTAAGYDIDPEHRLIEIAASYFL